MLDYADSDIKFLIGKNALENLSFEMERNNCIKPMLCCDDMSNRLGNKKILLKAYDGTESSFEYVDAKTNEIATVNDVERIVAMFNAHGCDSLVVLGRKSAIAAAKCAKIMLKEGLTLISQYNGKNINKYSVREVPLYVVPTNFGSGVECSNKIRIYEPSENKIYRFESRYASTNAVIVDERMTDIFPPKAIASYGLFALAMACETFVLSKSPYARPYATSAIEITTKSLMPSILRNAVKNPRTELLSAVVIAGYGYDMLNYQILSELSDIISDRYKANYSNIFAILFLQYIQLQSVDKDTLGELLLPLVGENEYALCVRAGRSQKTIEVIKNIYEKVKECVDFNYKLSMFEIQKSDFAGIAEQLILCHTDKEDAEATYSFIVNLLEKAF